MHLALLLGFAAAVTPLALTPGASFTLATQRTLAGERRGTGWVVAGTASGIYVHATLAALGLSALVLASVEAFTVVKLVGGAYLIGLGLWTALRTFRRPAEPRPEPERRPTAHAYPQALLANLLNPKAASVYLTLAPQFLTAGRVALVTMLEMASVHVGVMALWLSLWTALLRRRRRLSASRRFAAWVDRVSGAVLVALGIRSVTT